MSLNQASTTYAHTSDFDSLDAATMINFHTRTLEIAAQPEFYVFTSLIWIRQAKEHHQVHDPCIPVSKNTISEQSLSSREFPTVDHSQPDLGLLRLHVYRLAAAAQALQWKQLTVFEPYGSAVDVVRSSITAHLGDLPQVPPGRVERRKIRVRLNKAGVVEVDSTCIDCISGERTSSFSGGSFLPATLDLKNIDIAKEQPEANNPMNSNRCQVFLDARPSRQSLFTTHKTSHRAHYDSARLRAAILTNAPIDEEVLLYNKNGEVMEASLCTIYFLRQDQWVTPAAICGGNLGVTRRLAIENRLCRQGIIEVTELKDGETVWLSNGVRGFFLGQICLETQNRACMSQYGSSP